MKHSALETIKSRSLQVLGFLLSAEALCLIYGLQYREGFFLAQGVIKSPWGGTAAALAAAFAALLGIVILFSHRSREILDHQISRILEKPISRMLIFLGGIFLVYELFQDFLLIKADIEAVHYLAYRTLLEDYFLLFLWLFLIGIKILFLFSLYRWPEIKQWIKNRKLDYRFYIPAGLILIYLVGFDWFSLWNFPVPKDDLGFNELNAPLLGIQVILITAFLLLIQSVFSWIIKRSGRLSFLKRDAVLMVVIFLSAFLIWQSVPPSPKSFTDQRRPPNFEYYPIADTLNYEISAHRMLAGQSLGDEAHIGFRILVGILHLIAGDDYQAVLPFYLGLAALLPPLLYFLGRQIHSKFAGGLMAFLSIIRVRNSLYLGELITVPNPQEVMTEPLVAVGLVLIATILVEWVRDRRSFWLLLAGGLFGWLILLRVEVAAMLGAFVLGLGIFYSIRIKRWLASSGLVILGVGLVVSPWFISRAVQTGSMNALFMGRKYLLVNPIQEVNSPDPDQAQQSSPGRLELMPRHIVNDLKQSMYYLPSGHQPFLTAASLPDLLTPDQIQDLEGDSFSRKYLERYIRSLPYWWKEWDGTLAVQSYLPLILSLILVGIGFAAPEKKLRPVGLMLGLMTLAHFSIYAFVGKSGGRFIYIIDWVTGVYYAVGIAVILKAGKRIWFPDAGVFRAADQPRRAERNSSGSNPVVPVLGAGAVLLVWGMLIASTPEFFKPEYTVQALKENTAYLEETGFDPEGDLAACGAENPDCKLVLGKILYPCYFDAGEGEIYRKGRNSDISIARLEFYIVGTETGWAALPGGAEIEYFPHGKEALLLGATQTKTYDQGNNQISGEYLKVKQVWILPENRGEKIVDYTCKGQDCD